MNKFPVTSSVVYPDYDNTPTYSPSETATKPSNEDIFQQKPTDSLIKQSNNVVYPTNSTPALVQQTNQRNSPQKPRLGWIEDPNDINYPGKPTERFSQQPDVLNYARKLSGDVIEYSDDLIQHPNEIYPGKATVSFVEQSNNNNSPKKSSIGFDEQYNPGTFPRKPTVSFSEPTIENNSPKKSPFDLAEQANDLNYHRKPTVSFNEESDNICFPRKPSIGFVDQSGDINYPGKPIVAFAEQPNDINYSRRPTVTFIEQSNHNNSPHKSSIGFPELPNEEHYPRKSTVGLADQSNETNLPRKSSLGFAEQPNNINFLGKPTVSFTEQPTDITFPRKSSISFVDQPNDVSYPRRPTAGFEQFNDLKYPPKSTEDFSLKSTDASYLLNPTHVLVQQSRDNPFPKNPANSVSKKSGKDPHSKQQSHDFFTQSNDVISRRKSSGINGRTHGRVTVHVDDDSRHERQSSCAKCGSCCKKTVAFLVAHIGLCSLVVGYSIAGGFIFRELESPFEAKERSNVAQTRQRRVEELWNMTTELNVLFKENWTAEAEKILLTFQMDVFRATKEKGWDGKEDDSNLQWSFAGALLYSVTVITTIGYGHIAPKTQYGRLVTIFYALIGIPLTLLCLANIGRMFSDCFRFTYKYTCRCLKWTFLPSKPVFKRRAERKRNSSTRKRAKRQMKELERAEELIFSIEDQKEALEDEEEVRVPIFISMGVMALYIFGGAVLFMLWEDDWDYLIGSYFCFITLSTIGFGDFVPGASVDSWANQEKAILCTLYLVFGLSLIAMCFNLMQEEVKIKFRWLAAKLNMIDTHKNKR